MNLSIGKSGMKLAEGGMIGPRIAPEAMMPPARALL
jgi:hypothetical protein